MIPVSQPIIPKKAYLYISECLKTGWVSSAGSFVEKFEEAFADYVGTKYAVATSNGTSALHLSLAALDIGKGDEVIVPTFTMIASVLPILYQRATPVLVDVEEQTGNIDVAKIEAKITKRTKAIMPVHMYGHPADMDNILKLAKKYNLFVIEDAAEAHGALYKSKKVGSFGNTGCFSFYGNKIITTGEGGIVTTNSKKLAERMKSLRNLARTPSKHFLHQEVAYAHRMSNLQAALGLAELEEINKYIKRKRKIAELYNKLLANVPDVILPTEQPYGRSIFWQYGVRFVNHSPKKIAEKLARDGIETRLFFITMHSQPAFKNLGLFKNETYPVAEKLEQTGLCIPSGVALPISDIKKVVKSLQSALS